VKKNTSPTGDQGSIWAGSEEAGSREDERADNETEIQEPKKFLHFLRNLVNITRDTGQDVKLKCEAEGNPPPRTIKWYKNGVADTFKGDRFRIKHARRKYVLL